MGKNILILSVSAGAGHGRAAEALLSAAKNEYPNYHIVHIDVMTLVPKVFRKIYCDTYISLVKKHPLLWGYLYEKTDTQKVKSKFNNLRKKIEFFSTIKLRNMLKEHTPDLVVCTHFLPAEILSNMIKKKEINIPVWVQITDFDVHSLWLYPFMHGYIAPNEEVAYKLSLKGIARDKIYTLGIPIMPAFANKLSRRACARKLGVSSDKITFLLMSGGAGVNDLYDIAKSIIELPGDFQIIAIAGKNKNLLAKLKSLEKRSSAKLAATGFTDRIEKYMAVSDIGITKPGGLTASECLAMGLPMLIISPIPGQEERNADYLLEKGAALKSHDIPGITYRLSNILKHPEQLRNIARNAAALGRPYAARDIIKTVVENSGFNLNLTGDK